ncbi:MAG: DUF1624 domain-containing protein [Clostridiales bacterium]|jgi:uncharacterized membrane protein|nr:DUF1624 domain-containing protein [Clostridiales bacterium]
MEESTVEIAEKPAEKKVKKERVWEIDFLRGVCILLMVADHIMFDLWQFPYWVANFDGVNNAFFNKAAAFAENYWEWGVREAVRLVVVFIFLTLSGISCSLSRSNDKRLIKLAAAALLLSVVTLSADAVMNLGVSIVWGILHIMAFSLLVYVLLKKVFPNKYLYLGIGAALIAVGLTPPFTAAPYSYDITFKSFFEAVLGTLYLGADSYGIAPYTGIFLVGAYLGEAFYSGKKSLLPALGGKWSKPVEFVGRNTIWVYLGHQVLVFTLVMAIGLMCGYKIEL